MKKTTTIMTIIISILLVSLCTVAATYSVIIEVTKNDGLTETVKKIKVKDLLTNEDGSYNSMYYDLKNELDLTAKEADVLMESPSINGALQEVVESIIEYKVNNNQEAKLSDNEIYNLINQSVLDTSNIGDEVKSRIINKASKYRNDISDYIYDIEVSILGDNI